MKNKNNFTNISSYKELILNGSIFEDYDFPENFIKLPSENKRAFIKSLIESAENDLIPGSFRSYDIRIDSEKLPNHVVFYMGLKVIPVLKKILGQPERVTFIIGVGRSSEKARPSSTRIQKSYMNGMRLFGAVVFDLGTTTTPDAYFSAAFLKSRGINAVINISASHNPKKDNGIKHCLVHPEGFINSISNDNMNEFKQHVVRGNPEKDKSDMELTESLILKKHTGLIEKIFPDEHAFSKLHNIYVVASGIVGMDAMKALNRKYDGDFLKVLFSMAPSLELPRILKLCGEKWESLLLRLELDPNLKAPDFFQKNPLKDFVIVLDYAKGTAKHTGEIYRALGAKVIEIDKERGFNPLEEKNQQNLKEALLCAVINHPDSEVIGIAHDEDGDRLLVMRSDLVPVDGDRLLVLMCSQMDFSGYENKIPLVITEVKSRPETRSALAKMGIESLIVPTGFAFIKGAAITIEKALKNRKQYIEMYGKGLNLEKTTPVQIWAELSGHFGFSQDFSYLFDDASLMAVQLLLCLYKKIKRGAKPGRILIELDESFPRNPSSGELNIFLKTQNPHYVPSSVEKEALVNVFAQKFSNDPMVTSIDRTDGIQINFKNSGWILIRKSNNEDKFIVVTSAPARNLLNEVEKTFITIAENVKSHPIQGLILKEMDAQGDERQPDPYILRRIKELNLWQN